VDVLGRHAATPTGIPTLRVLPVVVVNLDPVLTPATARSGRVVLGVAAGVGVEKDRPAERMDAAGDPGRH
jgi:hypothetical protein